MSVLFHRWTQRCVERIANAPCVTDVWSLYRITAIHSFSGPITAYSDAIHPFALRRLPTVELCSPRGEVPWNIAVVHVGLVEQGYTAMPYLAPSWKSRPLLPSKPRRTTSALIGKFYIAAGQAGMALHTMAILQAYQADVLKEMDEGTGLTPEAVIELRRATDLALRATKHTARSVGHPMAGSVAAEHHLWLNLTKISEKEEVFLLDAPISQSRLFGEAVSLVVGKFRSAKTQSTVLMQFMPRRTRGHSTPSSSLSREQSLPRKESSGGSGAQATHPPPTTVRGARGWFFPRQRPCRQVDMKRPYRPATSANPGRSWPLGRN